MAKGGGGGGEAQPGDDRAIAPDAPHSEAVHPLSCLHAALATGALALALLGCTGKQHPPESAGTATPAPAAAPAAPPPPATAGSAATPVPAAATTPAAATPKPPAVRRGGTLALALAADPQSLDPLTANDASSLAVLDEIYDPLLTMDERLQPAPWLAQRWELSADGLTYTFHLRDGVHFQDGTPYDAVAQKFALDRMHGNPAAVAQDECGPRVVAGVEAPDGLTLRITLTAPDAAFLAALAGPCGMAVSPAAVEKLGNAAFALHPVGSGPFALGEVKAGDHVSLTRNPSYWRRSDLDGRPLPYLEKLDWHILPDEGRRLQMLQSGDLDLLSGDALPYDAIDALKQNAALMYDQRPGLGWSGFMLNRSRPPFSNRALAQAVQQAIDRDAVIQSVDHGYPPRADNGEIPPPFAWAIDSSYVPYRYDPDGARASLAAGGQPRGFSFTILADTSDPRLQQALALEQEQLAQIGIQMQVQQTAFAQIVARAQGGDFEAAALTVAGGLDPDSWVYPTFHSGGALNFPHLSDPRVDQLAEQARATRDPALRAELYKQATKAILDDGPWVMVSYRLDRFAAKKSVQGFTLGRYAGSSYATVWKSSG